MPKRMKRPGRDGDAAPEQRRQMLDLAGAAHYLVEECRMVLPGIQALFGFQLVAVFSARFGTVLDAAQQRCHLLALALVALSAALVMAPAAYHREVEPEFISERFMRISTRLLLLSMFPLAGGICLDFYLIARVIVRELWLSVTLATLLFCVIVALWFVLPWRWRRRRGV